MPSCTPAIYVNPSIVRVLPEVKDVEPSTLAYLPAGTVYFKPPVTDVIDVTEFTGVSPPKLAITHPLLTWPIVNHN